MLPDWCLHHEPGKKTGKKAGTVHRRTRLHSRSQTDAQAGEDQPTPGKPDFDEKDLGITPKRKAPGPAKRRRGSRPASSVVTTVSPSPEAKIKQNDHHSE